MRAELFLGHAFLVMAPWERGEILKVRMTGVFLMVVGGGLQLQGEAAVI